MVNKYHGNPLVEWEEFVPTAPHQAVILYTLSWLREVQPGLIVSYGKDDVKKYNPGKYEQISHDEMLWIKRNSHNQSSVTLVRNELTENTMTLEEYKL